MRNLNSQIIMYHTSQSPNEALKKMQEALEHEAAKARARTESIRKAEQKIQGYVATHFVLDEVDVINSVTVHGGDFNPPTRTQLNSMSSRKSRRNRDGGSDREPYYVKLTSKKRR